jgi:predicted RNA-binding protein with PUA domain
MSNNVSATQEARVTLSVQQLEEMIRKVVREEFMEFAMQEQGIFNLNKDSPLYEDIEDILERKKSGQLKFHTHEEVWNG